ncbi:MAG: hypothetical protein GVY13_03870, partial [Alphaproteobacteria bacterium]|nr:hypothetical protein [Alphaproteobacteria bacterium]
GPGPAPHPPPHPSQLGPHGSGDLSARAHAGLSPADESGGEPPSGPTAPYRAPPRRRPRRRRGWVGPLLLILALLAALVAGTVWLVEDIREGVAERFDRARQALAEVLPGDGGTGDDGTGAGGDGPAAAGTPAGEPVPAEPGPADEEAASPPRDGRDETDAAGAPAGIVPEPADTGGPAVDAAPASPVEVVELQDLDGALAPLPDAAPRSIRNTADLAISGDPDAQHDLATEYALGERIPQDYERAAFWYRLAADAGIANAQYNLAVLMQQGRGVPQDREAAFTLFREAAETGHTEAELAVGLALRHGHGVDRNLIRAASWFQAANASGDPRGAWYLGQMYEEGIDGAPDPAAAAGWYRLAAEGGLEEAEAALARLEEASGDVASSGEGEGPAAAEEPPVPVPPEEPTPVPADEPGPDALTREDIRSIQQLLADLGYEPGPVDGLMGDRTAQAIREFQEAQGMAVTGEPAPALLARLRAAAGAGPEN